MFAPGATVYCTVPTVIRGSGQEISGLYLLYVISLVFTVTGYCWTPTPDLGVPVSGMGRFYIVVFSIVGFAWCTGGIGCELPYRTAVPDQYGTGVLLGLDRTAFGLNCPCAAPLYCTTVLHHCTAPRYCTTLLYRCTAPLNCNTELHHVIAPRYCTTLLYRRTAPLRWTTAMDIWPGRLPCMLFCAPIFSSEGSILLLASGSSSLLWRFCALLQAMRLPRLLPSRHRLSPRPQPQKLPEKTFLKKLPMGPSAGKLLLKKVTLNHNKPMSFK